MSQYTTGELAKLCGVSVRTVQYYDTRGILTPSALSDGGRRLYNEADYNKLKIICFLRSLDLPIDSIRDLFAEEDAAHVIAMLLDEQEANLRRELMVQQARVDRIADVKKTLARMPQVSAESFSDIAYIMENKKKMRRLHILMLIVGFLMDAIQVSTLMIGIFTKVWWPFVAGFSVAIALGIWISAFYFRRTVYICPSCHTIFKPCFREAFFARHTPYTRQLTCTHCGHYGFCIETYAEEETVC